jgi:hypothetical protein
MSVMIQALSVPSETEDSTAFCLRYPRKINKPVSQFLIQEIIFLSIVIKLQCPSAEESSTS